MIQEILSAVAGYIPDGAKDWLIEKGNVPSMRWSLRNLKANGFSPRRAIDVGAYNGEWTLYCLKTFPGCEVAMVEPQAKRTPELEKMVQGSSGALSLTAAVLGPEPQASVDFHENESASTMLPEHNADLPFWTKTCPPMMTLDGVAQARGWKSVDLLKLDVQGYELEVLKGGAATLAAAEVVILELALIEINKGAPLFAEVVREMDQRGLRPYDVATLHRRWTDHTLGQLDMIFIRKDSTLVRKSWV